MRGLKIYCIKLNFYEDENHSSSQVVVEWIHNITSASDVLKMCGGIELPSTAMLGNHPSEQRALKTTRSFRFENREDALLAYDKFEEQMHNQRKERSQPNDG
jgi:hypothetical protein